MTTLSIKVEGLKQAEQRLRQFPEEMQRKVLLNAFRKGSNILKNNVQGRAPKKTGTLSKSITVTNVKNIHKRWLYPLMMIQTGKKGYYGRFIEYGWVATGPYKQKGITRGESRGRARQNADRRVKERPFFRPAFAGSGQAMVSMVKQTVDKWLKKNENKLLGSMSQENVG